MIYVTGDLHADKDRLQEKDIKKLKRADTLIVLGDFGFLWNGSKAEAHTLKWLSHRRYELCFIDGRHENFDLLKEYPVVDYKGGKARCIGKRLHYLMRGELYDFDGTTVFTMGGAESKDKDDREEGVNYWRAELPKADEMDKGEENLAKAGYKVDYVLTHDAPATLLMFIDMYLHDINWFEAYLDEIMKKTQYKRWLFACYHKDIAISPKAAAVYRVLTKLE